MSAAGRDAGLWRRLLIALPGEPVDTLTRVDWLQGPSLYVDLRQPAGLAGRVHARCLAELFNPVLYPGMGMRLAITQEEIGYLARVSRQRVNQALHALGQQGLLRVEYGAVEVLDLRGLRHYGS